MVGTGVSSDMQTPSASQQSAARRHAPAMKFWSESMAVPEMPATTAVGEPMISRSPTSWQMEPPRP